MTNISRHDFGWAERRGLLDDQRATACTASVARIKMSLGVFLARFPKAGEAVRASDPAGWSLSSCQPERDCWIEKVILATNPSRTRPQEILLHHGSSLCQPRNGLCAAKPLSQGPTGSEPVHPRREPESPNTADCAWLDRLVANNQGLVRLSADAIDRHMLQEMHHIKNHSGRTGPIRRALHAQLRRSLHGCQSNCHPAFGENAPIGGCAE